MVKGIMQKFVLILNLTSYGSKTASAGVATKSPNPMEILKIKINKNKKREEKHGNNQKKIPSGLK